MQSGRMSRLFTALWRRNHRCCDIRAVTQEERTVRQDVVPISDDDGRLIGVLIGERDISDDIRQEQKYEALVRRAEKGDFIHVSPEDAARREVHTA